jgi:hypothetical protein
MRKTSPKKLAISQEEYGFATGGYRRKIVRHQHMEHYRIDSPISGLVYREGLIVSKSIAYLHTCAEARFQHWLIGILTQAP